MLYSKWVKVCSMPRNDGLYFYSFKLLQRSESQQVMSHSSTSRLDALGRNFFTVSQLTEEQEILGMQSPKTVPTEIQ